ARGPTPDDQIDAQEMALWAGQIQAQAQEPAPRNATDFAAVQYKAQLLVQSSQQAKAAIDLRLEQVQVVVHPMPIARIGCRERPAEEQHGPVVAIRHSR